MFKQNVEAIEAAWSTAGRGGRPRLQSGARFALGPDARARAEAAYTSYYNFRPADSDRTGGAALTVEAIKEAVAAYREAGCDELIFSPNSTDPGQIDLLAKAVF